MTRSNTKQAGTSNDYARVSDFEQIFVEDMNSLYLLSLLLTGSRERAEKCFVTGLSECVKAKRVFKGWARSWARRMIFQAAIRLMMAQTNDGRTTNTGVVPRILMETLPLQREVSAILNLTVFDRIVFVMSTLEQYSDNDCAILLSCRRTDVGMARSRALRRLANVLGYESSRQTLTIARYFSASLGYERISV